MTLVGDALHNLIAIRLGVYPDNNCECTAWMDRMNEWGPKGCLENLDVIVAHMLSQARKQGWRFKGRPLLSLAAKVGTLTPWGMDFARTWARALITEAIMECAGPMV